MKKIYLLAIAMLLHGALVSYATTISGTATVCTGLNTTFTIDTSGGTWSSGNAGVASVNPATGIITGNLAGTALISYNLPGATFTRVVTVFTQPPAITGADVICEEAFTNLSNSMGTAGTWASGNTSIATVVPNGKVTGVGGGTALITYRVTASGCFVTREITVNPLPAPISNPGAVCPGAATTLTSAPAGGTWISGNTSVALIDPVSGTMTTVSGGLTSYYLVTISYTLPTGCRRVAQVTVNSSPGAIVGTTTLCTGNTSALTSGTPGGAWSSSNPAVASISTTGVVSALSDGMATISYIISTGCANTATVTVNSGIGANTGTAVVCVGQTTTLSNATSGGTWSSDAADKASVNLSTGVVSGVSAGLANIIYTVGAGCTSSTQVTINSVAVAITGTATICAGATTSLSHPVTGGTWSSSNIAVATVNPASGLVSSLSAGTSYITYTVSPGCFKTLLITVQPLPGTISGPALLCQGSTVTLSCSPAGGVWTSGSTNATVTTSTGIVTGAAAGTALLSYTLGGTCRATYEVSVHPLPAAISGTTSTCIGGTTALTSDGSGTWSSSNTARATVNATTGLVTGISAGTSVISYAFATGCFRTTVVTVTAAPAAISGTLALCPGNTTTLNAAASGKVWVSSNTAVASVDAATGVVTAISAGNAAISYAIGSCAATPVVVTVNAGPSANVGTPTICVGPNVVILTNPVPGGTWSASNSKVVINPTSGLARGVTVGTVNISYSTGTGCFVITNVTVNAAMPAITGPTAVCPAATVGLANTVTSGTWASSNTAKATIDNTTGIVTGVSAGSATITYMVSPGCYNTRTQNVSTPPATIGGTAVLCTGATTTLTNSTGGGTWGTGNAAVAAINVTTGSVSGISAGTANITYRVTSTGCTAQREVTVNPIPASITGTLSMCVGDATTLSNETTGGTWSSSLPGRATVDAGTGLATGISAGTAVISYMLEGGCYKTATITVQGLPAAIGGLSAVCPAATISLTNATAGGTWSSSNTAAATVHLSSGVVAGIATGDAIITYKLTSSGCYITKSIAVTTGPDAGTIMGGSSLAVGGTLALTNTAGSGVWSSSNAAIASVSGSGVVAGVSAGMATISYTVTSGCGSAVATQSITVNAGLVPITGGLNVCVGSVTALDNGNPGGTWSSSNEGVATVSAGLVTGLSAGTTTISYTSGPGTATAVVTVQPLPNAGAITGPASVDAGATITLSNSASGGAWSSSNSAIASVNSSGVVTGVVNGSVTISYVVGNGCGVANATKAITVTTPPPPSFATAIWATYLGGTAFDFGHNVAIDQAGNVYMSGYTNSTSGIATSGASQTVFGGSLDAYLAKFNSSGLLLWATYFGGSSAETNTSVAIDADGNVLLSGQTQSSSGIATTGAYQTSLSGTSDVFVVKYSSSGAKMWATYYGGSGAENCDIAALATNGTNVYLAGYTNSSSGIATAGAQQATFGGVYDLFLVKFNGSGVRQWATYYGNSGEEYTPCVATDGSGNVYLAGRTNSLTGIATEGTHMSSSLAVVGSSNSDAFLVKFNEAGERQWGTYFGGSSEDDAHSLATDNAGNVYMSGYTNSSSNISTAGAYQVVKGTAGVYLVKFNTNGIRQWGTYYGGTSGASSDIRWVTTTDLYQNVYLAGWTASSSAIATAGSHQTAYGGGSSDAFLAKFNGAGQRQWGTYFGGAGNDEGRSIAIDATGHAYMAGFTTSTASISTSGSHQVAYGGGGRDAFLVKFNGCGDLSAGVITGPSTVDAGANITLANIITGGTWSSSNTAIATVGSTGVVSGVAAGSVIISYTVSNTCGSVSAVKAVSINPVVTPCSLWQAVGIAGFSTGGMEHTSVTTDASGTMFVAYRDNSAGNKATVKKYNGSVWETVGSVGFSAGSIYWTSIKVDASGTPYISFQDDGNSGKATVMKYDGTNWITVGPPGISAGIAFYSSLAIDNSGTPYVAFRDMGLSGKASVMKFNGSVWVAIGGAGFTPGPISTTSLALNSSGTPYLAFMDGANGDKATVMKFNGTTWETVGAAGFSTGSVSYTYLALDGSGAPYVSYWDMPLGNKITVKKYDGTNWTTVGSPGFGEGTEADAWPAIAIDYAGTPYVSFRSNGGNKASVMKYNGSSWMTVGGAPASAGGAFWISIAINNIGTPIVAFSDNSLSGKATVMKFGNLPSPGTITGASTFDVGANITLSNTTPGGVWSSSNTAIATVGSTGIVTGIAVGSATISYTVTNACGSASATKSLTVNAAVDTVVIQRLWATYCGGSLQDNAYAVAVDNAGNVYIAGKSASATGIATAGAHQTTFGGGSFDAFLVKFNSSGVRQWATLFGGSGNEGVSSLAVDAAGNVFIAGETGSTSGIATTGAHQTSFGGVFDAFLAKFNSSGACQWATYYGGNSADYGYSIATSSLGDVYLAGRAFSSFNIATPGSHKATYDGSFDAYLAKFTNAGVRQWGTYFGGTGAEDGQAVAVDDSGNVFLAGGSGSSSGIATPGGYQTVSGGSDEAFLTKFNSSGTQIWGTYFGGSGGEAPSSLVIDGSNNIYMSGYTNSTSGIATGGAHQTTFGGSTMDAFLVKFSNSGAHLWGTYYGGTSIDVGRSVSVDTAGFVYLAGETFSTSGISSATGAYQPAFGGANDAFIVKLNSLGVRQWGTYYGSSNYDEGKGIAIDGAGNIYLTGQSQSTSGIATVCAHQPLHGGGDDGMLIKLGTCSGAPAPGTITGSSSVTVGATITLSTASCGGTWSSSNTAIATVGSTGIVTGVAAGSVTISYNVSNECGSASAVKAVSVNPTVLCQSWQAAGNPGFSAGQAEFESLAFNGSGTPYVAYSDIAAAGKATVMKYDGTNWVTVGSAGFSGGVAQYTSIAIDGSGTPYVAYRDHSIGFKATVMKYNGANWETVGTAGFSAGATENTSLAIDGTGTPYVGYKDGNVSNKATVMKYSGTTWVTVGSAGFSSSDVGATSLAIDGSGKPYLAFQDGSVSSKPTVMKYNGTTWEMVGIAGFSAGTASHISFALNGSTPYVVYQDQTVSQKATMMKYNGSSWVTVGSAGFSDGIAAYISMAIDGSGSPFVAYRDLSVSGKATVMKYSGSTWVTVGSKGFSAGIIENTSLAFNGGTVPYVAYRDYSNSHKVTVMKLTEGFSPITGSLTLCVGATTPLSHITSGGSWSSGATDVATVNSTGVVTGVAEGTATITYTAGECNATTVVTVNCAPRGAMTTVGDEAISIFSVSPNPTTGSLTIHSGVAGEMVVYTIDGREITRKDIPTSGTTLSLPTNLAAGIYMFRFKGADGSSRMGRLVYQP
jgi:uncharacterized protein YjdB